MRKRFALLILGSLLCLTGTQAMAVALTNQCSTGGAINGISTSDVLGVSGGSTDCFGTFDGNSSGPGSSVESGSDSWDFVSKFEMDGGTTEGTDIGLYAAGGTSGEWSYDPLAGFDSFLLVLKAAHSPGWSAWLFDGSDAASTSGTWSIAWDRDLSHISLFASTDDVPVPTPGTLALFGLALLALGLAGRRRQ